MNEVKKEVEESPFRLRTIISDQDVVDLRKPSDPVVLTEDNKLDVETQKLVEALKNYISKHNGLGMAAVQLGVHKRLFVMRRPFNSNQVIVVVNPQLLSGRGKTTKVEGCFSIPDTPADPMVRRFSIIDVSYVDELGNTIIQERLVGMDARIFQHELDHLNGILMIDKKPQGRGFRGWRARSF